MFCVGDFSNKRSVIESNPVKGNMYTIREAINDHPDIGLLLVEVTNGKRILRMNSGEIMYSEPTFCSSGFRPVDYSYGTEVCEAIETEFKKLKEPVTL